MLSKEEILAKIPYLSASRIHTFMQCPSSFFLKYVYQIADAETNDSYAKYGTLCHNIFEGIAKGEYFFIEDCIEEYEKGYPECGLTEKQYEQYYESGKQAIYDKWNFLNSDEIEVVGAESKFSAKFIEGAPKFFGFVDLIYRDQDGHLIVRDYKSSKKYTKQQLAHNIQAYVYAEACYQLFGEYPHAFEFDFFRFGKSHMIIIDKNYLQLQKLRVQGIWKQIASGVQTGKWTGFYCENFCEGRNHCPIFQSKKGGKRK